MPARRLDRLAPLTGVLFAVAAVVAVVTSGNTPNANASAVKVVTYFAAHRSSIEVSNIFFIAAFQILVLFAAALRSFMRRSEGAEGLATLFFGGALLMAGGATIASAVEYGLAHNLSHLSPASAQTMNILSNEIGLIGVVAGAAVFGLGGGLAILRGVPLPSWLGWALIVIAILALVPPTASLALLLLVIWSLVVSILVYRRFDQAPSSPVGEAPPVAAAP